MTGIVWTVPKNKNLHKNALPFPQTPILTLKNQEKFHPSSKCECDQRRLVQLLRYNRAVGMGVPRLMRFDELHSFLCRCTDSCAVHGRQFLPLLGFLCHAVGYFGAAIFPHKSPNFLLQTGQESVLQPPTNNVLLACRYLRKRTFPLVYSLKLKVHLGNVDRLILLSRP